jgi:amino acid adenylation domain-containing protein
MAGKLTAMGVEHGDRVALVLPKTSDAVIWVFATLLGGGVYVPIHPKWPADRIEAAIEDCGAKVVVDRKGAACRPAQGRSAACPAGTAVIFFTSGSTGQPKGVVLTHHAVAAFVRWSAAEFQIGPADRIACPSPLGFDLSTFDVFNMALGGAACVLVPDHISWMPRFVVRYMAENRVTAWYSVPSILARMLRDGGLNRETASTLRTILFAGEVCPGPDLALLLDVAPQAVCANLYGPTETNVVTFWRAPANFDPGTPPPIGRPCPFARIRIDDSTGELLAGGESLMTGYWNRPEETARAFASIDGQTYYRTGDRVHTDGDGEIQFVGRLDRQVKRRGYRIELGEIEIALSRHPDIVECGVVAGRNQRQETVITAFVRAGGELSLLAAKAHCAQTLPPYMTPDQIRFTAAIPRGARGKIDYSALQRLAEESSDGD